MFRNVVCLCLMLCCVALSRGQNLPHKVFLDSGVNFTLSWNYNETHITFEDVKPQSEKYSQTYKVEAATTGWIGIGFEAGGGMKDADIYVGWVKDGVGHITDRHGPSKQGYPPKDAEQNLDLVDAEESDGTTRIRFVRPLVACDGVGLDKTITGDTTRMIFAWSDSDPAGDDLESSEYHGQNRVTKSLILLEPNGKDDSVFPSGETHQSFDLLNDNFHVPDVETHYNCRMFKIPEFDEKQHLVKIEPVIQPGNEMFVHHMILFQCSFPRGVNESAVGSETMCYGNMPPDFYFCRYITHAWAIGGATFYYPNHVGLPLGTRTSPKFAVLETHYDNPSLTSGIIDSSGLRFTYTPNLRKWDAAIFEVGHSVSGFNHLIPPGLESFLDHAECTDQCLAQTMSMSNLTNINVFAINLHSHLLGRQMTLKHIRNGTELEPLARDLAFDFNYQETRTLVEERSIEPGDSMQLLCNYDSRTRQEVTVGGLNASKEMCLSFVFYYPAFSLGFCETAPDMDDLMTSLGITSYEMDNKGLYTDLNDVVVLEPEEFANQTAMQIMNEMNWNEETGKKFSDDLKMMKRAHKCYIKPVGSPPGIDWQYPAVVIDHPYVEEPVNCDTTTAHPTSETTLGQVIETTSSAAILQSFQLLFVSMALVLTSLVY